MVEGRAAAKSNPQRHEDLTRKEEKVCS